jgi:hypothetical protein
MGLFHDVNKSVFIILYNHYLLKISELKNQMPKLRFKILLIIPQSTVEMVKVLL